MGVQWHHYILPWVTLKGQGHSDFEALYRKGAELGNALLLNINRKSHIRSPMAPSHLTLTDL